MSESPVMRIEFSPSSEPELVYHCVSAITDLALTEHGASIAAMDRIDTALLELVGSLSQTNEVSRAIIDMSAERLEIAFATRFDVADAALDLELLEVAGIDGVEREPRVTRVRIPLDRRR